MRNRTPFCVLLLCGTSLSACISPTKNVFFATKTTWGVDVDASPPTFDLGFARQEGSVAPVTDAGAVLPLMSSFSGRGGLLSQTFGFRVAQSFAVGNAALILARYIDDNGNPAEEHDLSALFTDGLSEKTAAVSGKLSEARPYFFGTHTTLGFRVDLPTTTGLPQGVHLGWKRKELAVVPIHEKDGQILLPSMIATTGANADSSGTDAQAGVDQFYATGLAASYLASSPQIRGTLGARIVAEGAATELARKVAEQEVRSRETRDLRARRDVVLQPLSAAELQRAADLAVLMGLAPKKAREGLGLNPSDEDLRKFLTKYTSPGTDDDGTAERVERFLDAVPTLRHQ
ncbi:MAG: hypothetical protein GC161_10425 [Planctomycetaceae bacterium]|nr:hypothetical protein [Planctomycetaceae bacterium]